MKWSWKLGEFAGIGIYVHATFPTAAKLPVSHRAGDGNRKLVGLVTMDNVGEVMLIQSALQAATVNR